MLKIYSGTLRDNDWTVHAIDIGGNLLRESIGERGSSLVEERNAVVEMWKEHDVQWQTQTLL